MLRQLPVHLVYSGAVGGSEWKEAKTMPDSEFKEECRVMPIELRERWRRGQTTRPQSRFMLNPFSPSSALSIGSSGRGGKWLWSLHGPDATLVHSRILSQIDQQKIKGIRECMCNHRHHQISSAHQIQPTE